MTFRAMIVPSTHPSGRGPREQRPRKRIVARVLMTFAWLAFPTFASPAPVDEGITAYEQGDYERSLRLFQASAEQDDPIAEFYLGLMYLDGKGVVPDARAAASWFRRAAAQKHPAAQYNLGVAYYEGQGVTQSFTEAADWFRRSAEQRYGPAAYNLAAMYEDGLGLDRDPDQALHWYERAAKAGLAEAMHELAAINFSGRLGPADPVRAYMWLLLAVRHGDEDAVPDRLDVKGALSPEQIREAEELAASWKNP